MQKNRKRNGNKNEGGRKSRKEQKIARKHRFFFLKFVSGKAKKLIGKYHNYRNTN